MFSRNYNTQVIQSKALLKNAKVNSFTQHSEQNNRQPYLPILSKAHSLNRCREKVRRERALFLKECANTTLRDRNHVKELGDPGKAYSKKTEITSTLYVQQKRRHNRLNKGVWRGVVSTFMRNGSKLRYQTMLRKALLEL